MCILVSYLGTCRSLVAYQVLVKSSLFSLGHVSLVKLGQSSPIWQLDDPS
jgi:hypothetical protein